MKKTEKRLFIQFFGLVVLTLFAMQVNANNGISLKMISSNKTAASNSISTQLTLQNRSEADLDLENVSLRYYYTKDNDITQNFWFDNAAIKGSKYKDVKSKIDGRFVNMEISADNADNYFEIRFLKNAGVIEPGNDLVINYRIAKSDWSNYNQSNDYSFKSEGYEPEAWEKVTVFQAGNLIWGTEPQADENSDEEPEEEITGLAFKMVSANKNANTNSISTTFVVENTGTVNVNLHDINLLYFFTNEDSKEQNFWCDYAKVDGRDENVGITSMVKGKFVQLDSMAENADTYLRIYFENSGTVLKAGQQATLNIRFAKADWSNYDQSNDYSFKSSGDAPEDWVKIVGYLSDSLIWGNPPPTIQEEEEAVGPAVLELSMQSTNKSIITNSINATLIVRNTGEGDADLTRTKVRYYYTIEETKPQNFWCDNASISGLNEQHTVTNKVEGTFGEMDKYQSTADHYLEVGFKNGIKTLKGGQELSIKVRFSKTDWSDYDQSNDYSFKPEGNMENWDKVSIAYSDSLVWGVIPIDDDVDYVSDSLTVSMFSPSRSANTIYLNYLVENNGDNDISLSDITLHYYYSKDSEEEQRLWCDHAAVYEGSVYNQMRSEVTADFVELDEQMDDATHYALIGFDSGDRLLKSGQQVVVNIRIANKNWSSINAANDYSYNAESRTSINWFKTTAYIREEKVWGIEPIELQNMYGIEGLLDDAVELNALTDFYQYLGGSQWKHNTHWFSDTLISKARNWYGLSVAYNDVRHIILSNNQLIGEIPESIGDLTELRKLKLDGNGITGGLPQSLTSLSKCTDYDFRNNQITGIPGFTSHREVDEVMLFVDNNYLDFGDLEPFFISAGNTIIKKLSYQNQLSKDSVVELTFNQTRPMKLTANVPGDHNIYQWQIKQNKGNSQGNGNNYEWVDLEGESGRVFKIDTARVDDAGIYRCEITNSWVPDLTLYSYEFDVTIDEYYEITFQLDFRAFENELSYEIIMPEFRDTVAFSSLHEFTIPNPFENTVVLLNILDNNVSIDYGYRFEVTPNAEIVNLELVKGMQSISLNEQLFGIENGLLSLYPINNGLKDWGDITLTLEGGLTLSPNGDGNFDEMRVIGTDSTFIGMLEIYTLSDEMVYTTSGQDLSWDGKNSQTNLLVSQGVYKYILSGTNLKTRGQFIVKY